MKTPARRGLHVFHNSNQARRVELAVPAGDELTVSPTVAAQLAASSTHFEVDADELAAALEAERVEAEKAAAEEAEVVEGGDADTAAEIPRAGGRTRKSTK